MVLPTVGDQPFWGRLTTSSLDGMGGWGLRSHVNVGCRQGGPGR